MQCGGWTREGQREGFLAREVQAKDAEGRRFRAGRREKGGQVLEVPIMQKLLGVFSIMAEDIRKFLLYHSPFSLYIFTFKNIKSGKKIKVSFYD